MNKSTLPVGIKTLIGWKNKGTLTFDNPIQRSGSQWTLLQKSLLIHSILFQTVISLRAKMRMEILCTIA